MAYSPGSENLIQKQIELYAQARGFYVMRPNAGKIPLYNENGGRRFIRLAEKGTPDLLMFRNSKNGVELLFVEVKRPGKKPSIYQVHMMERLKFYGAKCIVATSIDDFERQTENTFLPLPF